LRRSVSVALLLLLLLAVLPVLPSAQAQGGPKIAVNSSYILDRYGFATINESVRFTNNESSAVQVPSLTFGFGNLSSDVAAYNLTGSGFILAVPSSPGGPFSVSSSQSIQAGGNASYVLSALLNGVVSEAKNGSLQVSTLSTPSISAKVDTLLNVIQMPSQTSFVSTPKGLTANLAGSNNTYSSSATETSPQTAVTSREFIESSSVQDFNPLHVYSAERSIMTDANGNPLVTDTIEFQNMGTTPLSTLYVNPAAPEGTTATIETITEPRLLSPVTVSLIGDSIDLTQIAVGYPSDGVPAETNFTITYQYPLGASHYTSSGGQVTVHVPTSPPIKAFIDSYTVQLSLPQGASASKSTPVTRSNVGPWQTGQAEFSYGLSVGFAIGEGVPLATVVFVLLLVGLFATRGTTAEAEGTEEEESSSELASTMIQSFDEKTNLINSLWSEIAGKDPNELDKEYFDELRSRLDTFRSRALQRLNEVKQKSTSQKFFEVVSQIHATEREVDRASKDKLNLYQQYYLRQMRREVYDRLLPQYTKRLEKALNQLSDELHTVQREAKLL
jgi:hypothetical protein